MAFVVGVLAGPLMPTSASAVDLVGGYTLPDGHINLTKGDLEFILDQIKISEAHAARTVVRTPSRTAPYGYGLDQCLNATDIATVNALSGANSVSRPYTFNPNFPIGLRQVDARCNNITSPANAGWGAADEIFPRLIPRAPISTTSYPVSEFPNSVVTDSSPRVISNVIVDQTATNKAAVVAGVAAAGRPNPDTEVSINATTQSRTTVVKIGNTAPGGGAPYNGWFTLFGQFFDHGLDLLPKGNNGKVTVPLKPSDPLYVQGGRTNFMQLTRATNTSGESISSQHPTPTLPRPWIHLPIAPRQRMGMNSSGLSSKSSSPCSTEPSHPSFLAGRTLMTSTSSPGLSGCNATSPATTVHRLRMP